jgi:D-glycero-D-manno-heptose 1,7-bisphosphate phosphatase
VVNHDTGYLHRIEDCVFIDGIFELLTAFQRAGFRLIIATNQAGIGRGFYGEGEFRRLMQWIGHEMVAYGVVYYCADHPTETIGGYRRSSTWRKPSPGMLIEAIETFGLDPAASWQLGDQEHDMSAAGAAGIGTRGSGQSRWNRPVEGGWGEDRQQPSHRQVVACDCRGLAHSRAFGGTRSGNEARMPLVSKPIPETR